MKKIILILCLFVSFMTKAQIPYFAKTVGQNRMYAYTSMKVRPGINSQETYTTFQYGLSNSLATGLDLYTSNGNSYWGVLMRYGASLSKYFNIGVQVTPSFNLSDNFKFSYLTSALYLMVILPKMEIPSGVRIHGGGSMMERPIP